MLEDGALVVLKHGDIDVAVIAGLAADPGINGPAASGIFAAHQVGITATRSFSLQLLALPFGAGTSGRGIVPGSAVGPPAEDTTDFNVAGVISNGSGGGQLLYQNEVMNALETIAWRLQDLPRKALPEPVGRFDHHYQRRDYYVQ